MSLVFFVLIVEDSTGEVEIVFRNGLETISGIGRVLLCEAKIILQRYDGYICNEPSGTRKAVSMTLHYCTLRKVDHSWEGIGMARV